MATEEHQQLAAFVKNVHQMLRSEAQKIGVDEAWKVHCSKSKLLQEYAVSMQKLASKHWDKNAEDENKSAQSRIKWVVEKCINYFLEGEREKRRTGEEERSKKVRMDVKYLERDMKTSSNCVRVTSKETEGIDSLLTMLDVGSCYNPFKVYPFFHVIPIDLAPATPDVYICDFLGLNVVETGEIMLPSNKGSVSSIAELPSHTFDVVVFSLFLEYLPSPKQRYSCVYKAYNLLKSEGLLFIITPDSKHSSANAPLMRRWRILLAQLGFSRVYYEKLPHIHCMAYRKDINSEIQKHWASYTTSRQPVTNNNADLYIPQDFHDVQDECNSSSQFATERTDEDDVMLADMFSQLPYDNN